MGIDFDIINYAIITYNESLFLQILSILYP